MSAINSFRNKILRGLPRMYFIFVFLLSSFAIHLSAEGRVFSGEEVKKIKSVMTFNDTIVCYDNHEGYFELNAEGNQGSFMRLTCRYNGFYVLPNLVLSKAIQENLNYAGMPGEWYDAYAIIPKSITVNAVVGTKSIIESYAPLYRKVTRTLNAHYSHIFIAPPPPENPNFLEISQWFARARDFDCNFFHTWFKVRNEQPAGGKASMKVYIELKDITGTSCTDEINEKMDYHTKTTYMDTWHDEHEGKASFGFTAQTGPAAEPGVHKFSDGFPLSNSWIFLNDMVIENEFSLENLVLNLSGMCPTRWETFPIKYDYKVLSDTNYKLSYKLSIAPKMEVDAVLEPVDQNESQWEPKVDQIREYRLRINEPAPEQVDAVRFRLEETSSHKGIATNAGNHLIYDKCPDCSTGKSKSGKVVVTDFDEVPVRRYYYVYNECPIDTLPDIFFRNTDNPDCDLGEEKIQEKLNYTVSQEIIFKKIDKNEYIAKIYVKDGAASGNLIAEISIGGLWYQARAEGKTAIEDNTMLRIPLDKNMDGIQDSWESKYNVSSPDEDKDAEPNPNNLGDGLTSFEEYRGIYEEGTFDRLNPSRKQVFVHDQTKRAAKALNQASTLYYNKHKLDMRILRGEEMRDEIVNFQDTPHKKGSQYCIITAYSKEVVEKWESWVAGKANPGPPSYGNNLVISKLLSPVSFPLSELFGEMEESGTPSGTAKHLAHEIGHVMGMPHHGERDAVVKSGDNEYWVACIGGQHSGNFDCIMKYNCADLFYDNTFVPKSYWLWSKFDMYQKYTAGTGMREFFCNSPKGTGANSGGNLCEDAAIGDCIHQLKLKSY